MAQGFGAPEWGIFDSSGNTVLAADSVFSVEYSHDYEVSDYPQEKGAFESFNKVQRPFQGKVTFLVGGINEDRGAFLQSLEEALFKLDLYTIVTPEFSYPSCNLTHAGYRRVARNGVSMIKVEVWAEEIRVIAQGQLSASGAQTGTRTGATGSVNGVDAQNSGPAQTLPTQETAGGGFATVGSGGIPSGATLDPPT